MLNVQQEIFCELYLKYGNATKAYKGTGYSGVNPGQSGHELLKNPEIQAYIAARREAIVKNISVSREEMIQEYKRCMQANVKDLFDEEDNPLNVSDMTVDTAATISSIDFMVIEDADGKKKRVIEKLRRVDKLEAMKELSKMCGFNLPTDPHKNKIPLTIDEIEIVYSNPASLTPGNIEPGDTTQENTPPEPPKTPDDAD